MSEMAEGIAPQYLEPESEEGIAPFYLEPDSDQFTQLEAEHSVLPPDLREGYIQVESRASKAFLKQFGQYLSEDQLAYFEGQQVLVTDHPTAEFFLSEWQGNMNSIDPEDANVGGNVYLSYSIGRPAEHERDMTSLTDSGSATTSQLWAGRIVVHPLAEEEIVPLGKELLMDMRRFIQENHDQEVPGADDKYRSFQLTNAFARTVVHEKTHGIQDWRLPLPILEAAAYYYEQTVTQESGWKPRLYGNSGVKALANYYGDCVAELGDDVHRLMFGNLEPARRQETLTALKERFNSDMIEKLSQTEHNPVFWRTIPVSEIK